MKKLLSSAAVLLFFLFSSALSGLCAVNKQIDANVKTKRLNEGTIIPLRLLDNAASNISLTGSHFDFSAAEDIKSDDGSVVIPKGSAVRGYIERSREARRLYRSGYLRIYFDHVVSTSGRQTPLYAGICNNPDVMYDGALGADTSYSDAFRNTIRNTKNVVVKPVKWSWEQGGDMFNGWPKYVFAPLTAVVCTPAAGLFFIGDTIADVFKKGSDVYLHKDDIIYIQLLKPLDMPVY